MADATPQRLSFESFVAEIRNELFSLDHGFLHTARLMLTRPGPTIAGYWRGEQPGLTRPLRYFLIVFSLYAIAFVSTGAIALLADDVSRQMVAGINQARTAHGLAAVTLEQARAANPLSLYQGAPLAFELFNAAMLFLTSWIAFARWGLNVAERMSLAFYLYGTFNLIQVPLVFLVFTPWRTTLFGVLTFAFAAYLMWTAATLREPRRWTAALRGLAWWLSIQVMGVVLVLVFGARLGMRLAAQDRAAAKQQTQVETPIASPTTAPAAAPPTR